jgi:hypothetical protein
MNLSRLNFSHLPTPIEAMPRDQEFNSRPKERTLEAVTLDHIVSP